jgi:MgtE intracellular N domain
MRGEDGEIHREFVERVARAIKAGDAAILRRIVAELHEADLGDLIAALEPDDRVSLVELTGTDFDFSALNEVDNTVREEILEELEPETVAEGVRELESDDAVELSRQSRRRSSKGCRAGNATGWSAASTIRRTRPAGGCRPTSSRSAELDRWTSHRLSARDAGSVGSVLRNPCRRKRPALAGRGVARCAAACAPAGSAGRPD